MPSPVLAMRVTPEVHEQVLERAATSGTTVTDVLRELVEAGLTVTQMNGAAVPSKATP